MEERQYLKKIVTENFPGLIQLSILRFRSPVILTQNKTNTTVSRRRVKLPDIKEKEEVSKSSHGEEMISHKGTTVRSNANFSTAIIKARRH